MADLPFTRLWLALFSIMISTACVSSDRDALRDLEKRYITTYYDRNQDGIVDFEFHDVPDMADDAWALVDTKFRGRYDLRLKWGYVPEREKVDLPVPRNVKITPGEPRFLPANSSTRRPMA